MNRLTVVALCILLLGASTAFYVESWAPKRSGAPQEHHNGRQIAAQQHPAPQLGAPVISKDKRIAYGEEGTDKSGDKNGPKYIWIPPIIVAAIGVYLSWLIYGVYERQAGIMDRQATIAHEQTTANKAMQRASLGVEPCGVSSYIPREGDDRDARDDNILGHFGVRNTGHVPARNVRWRFDGKFWNDDMTAFPLEEKIWRGGTNVIPPGVIMRQGGEALVLPKEGRAKYMYVWGRVEYEDGFGEPRSTNFCHRYNLARISDTEPRIKAKYGRYYEYGNEAE